MNGNKVILRGSELHPVGKRVGDLPRDEEIEVSVILRPKERVVTPQEGGAVLSREEFAARHGASIAAIDQVRQFALENKLTVTEVSAARRTVKLRGTAGEMCHAFDVKLDRYEHEG